MKTNPEFIVYAGSMYSGKSSRLIAAVDRFMYQKKNVAIFKPKLDDRFSESEIVTHAGLKLKSTSIDTGEDILEFVADREKETNQPVDVIAVDEAFMIEGVGQALIRLYRMGKTIIVASIDMSASCKPFTELVDIMIWATKIEKCPAVCVKCHQDAYYTQKLIDDLSDEIHVGGQELYEARCWKCHRYIPLDD